MKQIINQCAPSSASRTLPRITLTRGERPRETLMGGEAERKVWQKFQSMKQEETQPVYKTKSSHQPQLDILLEV